MKIVVGSSSERKIKTVERVFKKQVSETIEVLGHSATSGVPSTPYGEQTFQGSRNRALDSKKSHQADFFVGLESGLVERYGQLYEEAWTCIINSRGEEFFGYSSGLKLPKFVLERMKKEKLEHCDVMTLIEEELGKLPNDTWRTYSGGVLNREVSLEESLRNALIQALPHKGSLYIK